MCLGRILLEKTARHLSQIKSSVRWFTGRDFGYLIGFLFFKVGSGELSLPLRMEYDGWLCTLLPTLPLLGMIRGEAYYPCRVSSIVQYCW